MAGRIPKEFIDDLISRIDIVDIIDARIPLKKKGGNYTACCPFHSEKTPSFTVSAPKQFFHCFGCGAHGSAISFLMDYDHLGFVEAIEELASHAGVEVPREETDFVDRQAAEKNRTRYDFQQQVADWYVKQLKGHPDASMAVNYLKKRGVSGVVARDYLLGFAPPGWSSLLDVFGVDRLEELGLVVQKDQGRHYDRFRSRIMFPIRNRRGQVVGFGGRVLDDSVPKYLNSPETPIYHKGRELYGLYEALQGRKRPPRFLVVEGYMDVIALAQFGIDYAVAALGTAATADQIGELFRHASEVVFCFDGDEAGKKAAWKAMETALPMLRNNRSLAFMLLPDGEDPDSLVRKTGVADFERQIGDAQPLSQFLFDSLLEQNDVSTIEGRAALVDQAKPLIEKIPSPTFKEMMLGKLKELAQAEAVSSLNEKSNTVRQEAAKRPLNRMEQKPSAIRTVITLLLNQPHLASRIETDYEWRKLEARGMTVLNRLIDLLNGNPQATTGWLFEQFRGEKEEGAIRRLVSTDETLIEEDLAEHLDAAVKTLARQQAEQKIERLLVRADKLTEQEKRELSEALSAKQNSD